MRFTKYHGLGNDFVVVEVNAPDAISPELAKQLCDRHFGIGADGVLLVSPSSAAAARMTVLNADGSRPEMCGNGLRCVALHVSQNQKAQCFDVETDAGVLACELIEREGAKWIKISLGNASPLGQLRRDYKGQILTFHRVATGNPHAVVFDTQLTNAEIDAFAPTISGALPGGANIEFVTVQGPRHLQVVVWERGVGRTLACGTGAGAVVMAAASTGRVPFDAPIRVGLPGGDLEITVRESDAHLELCGPAELVFSGEFSLPTAKR
jgi:diaminopimelate epimerase